VEGEQRISVDVVRGGWWVLGGLPLFIILLYECPFLLCIHQTEQEPSEATLKGANNNGPALPLSANSGKQRSIAGRIPLLKHGWVGGMCPFVDRAVLLNREEPLGDGLNVAVVLRTVQSLSARIYSSSGT